MTFEPEPGLAVADRWLQSADWAVASERGPARRDDLPTMLGLVAVFVALTFMVFAAHGFGAAAVRDHVLRRPWVMNWFRCVFAATFVALSGRLALESL